MKAENDKMLTTDEACQYFKVSRWALWRMRRAGIIKEVYRVGTGPRASLRWSLHELREWLKVDDKKMWEAFQAEKREAKPARSRQRRTDHSPDTRRTRAQRLADSQIECSTAARR